MNNEMFLRKLKYVHCKYCTLSMFYLNICTVNTVNIMTVVIEHLENNIKNTDLILKKRRYVFRNMYKT